MRICSKKDYQPSLSGERITSDEYKFVISIASCGLIIFAVLTFCFFSITQFLLFVKYIISACRNLFFFP